MYLKGKILFSVCFFAVFCISNVSAECPELEGHWTCDNNQKFKITRETVIDRNVFRIYSGKIHFVYTSSDDASIPTVYVASRTKVSLTAVGAVCLLDDNGKPFFRVGVHPSETEGHNARILTDYSISDDDQLVRNVHFTRDTTSLIGDLESNEGRTTTCARKK